MSNPVNNQNTPFNPPDGGYGWVIVFAVFLNSVVFGGFVHSSGVLYVALLETFNASKAETGFIYWIAIFPASAMIGKYFCEKMKIAAGIAMSGVGAGQCIFPILTQVNRARDIGIPSFKSASLTTLMGMTQLVCRIVWGVGGHFFKVKPYILYGIGMSMCGIISIISVHLRTYEGWMRDVLGDYDAVFYITGTIYNVSAIFAFLMPVVDNYNKKHKGGNSS
uniref:Monocarboxylate transporter 12-like n=1 Tax=Saccoglossus kowalevskii TaxID=10224 RepID=A0ABM0LZN6_SACKO|nr:PREDICTED: monocarboxylate transporter 12-like [Saccoglossus kowalevskii]